MAVKTTRITVERDTIVVVRNAKADRGWCELCGAEVEVISLESDGLAAVLRANETERWIEAVKLHVLREPGRPSRVCLGSLLRCFEPQLGQRTNCEKEKL